MIEIRINKEIGTYEPKIFLGLTVRQLICIVIAAPVCFLLFNVLSPIISSDLAGFFLFPPAIIAWFFGWKKPYGMPAEQFIRSIFVTSILAPSHRKYKTVNRHEAIFNRLSSGTESGIASPAKKATKKARYKVSSVAVK